MEGRDIGTVILPDAELKVFWLLIKEYAKQEEEMMGKLIKLRVEIVWIPIEELLLKESDGSLRIDTTANGVEEVFAIISDKLGIYETLLSIRSKVFLSIFQDFSQVRS